MSADDDEARAGEYTHAKIWGHIFQKGFQLGSTVGIGVVVPVALVRSGGFKVPSTVALQHALQAAGVASLAGVGFASALTLLQPSVSFKHTPSLGP